MEEVGGQVVAPPLFIHQHHQNQQQQQQVTMPKKRHHPFLNPNYQHQSQLHKPPNTNWNPNSWDWDTLQFRAKPTTEAETENGTWTGRAVGGQPHLSQHQTNKVASNNSLNDNDEDQEGPPLALNLGGSLYSVEYPIVSNSSPNKRIRSGSPPPATATATATYPICQVDDCKRDLSNAKDYHRRHKVCELHSKTTKALVANQMQRFCQQCSRFHSLPEFDEGKRSCRRRLAGHNRRRRKTQPEDVSSQRHLLPTNQEGNAAARNLDITNLFTVLTHLQGYDAKKAISGAPIPDKDQLIQILDRINSTPLTTSSAARLPVQGYLDLNVPQEALSEQPIKLNGSTSPSMDLHAALSAAVAASSPAVAASSPAALTLLNQRRSQNAFNDKKQFNCVEEGTDFNAHKEVLAGIPTNGVTSSANFQPSIKASNCQVEEVHPSVPLRLFNSPSEDDSPPKLRSSMKYFSSASSNQLEERSPSSSPPIVQKLFPIQPAEFRKHASSSACSKDNGMVETSVPKGGGSSSLQLFNKPNNRADDRIVQSVTCSAGYTSSSGSDHSPSSSNSDVQNRTGRIIFKLFDKDPNNLPATLRNQIFNWLSHSPSEMESYIRPGCIVLSIYIAMPVITWAQLQQDFYQRVKLLLEDSDSKFWRNGRFLVHTDRQLASHKNGKIRVCNSWRASTTPELISVSPLAVVTGQETSLALRGRNLTLPGTKIHCTYMGKYITKKVTGSAGNVYDSPSMASFCFPSKSPCLLGRCFVEVENGLRGNSFPVIIADATICGELRLLESELEDGARMGDQVLGCPKLREEVVHFLNELGWLFQKNTSYSEAAPKFSLTRFRFLLTFSVERDWCALVKTLLDIFVKINSEGEGLSRETLDILDEFHLLHCAVKRKSVDMVNLLISYSFVGKTDSSKTYLFNPSKKGPGGITPLHLAACALDSEKMVDALTNDPREIGLSSWISILDANGQSPYGCAVMRGNHCYNKLVAQKLADRKNGQVSILVGNGISLDRSSIQAEEAAKSSSQPLQGRGSCARCAVVMARHCYRRMPGAQGGLLHRPYVHSMLAIAAVCVCVCLFLRGSPDIGRVAPFKWENVHFGTN